MGGGSNRRLYDIINLSLFTIDSGELRDKVQLIHSLFARLSGEMKRRLKVPLERLNQAKRRLKLVDRAIDLGIALESLFLQDDPPRVSTFASLSIERSVVS